MTTSRGDINTAAGPRAERIVDGSDYHVQLNLDALADTLLDQIGTVLFRERRTWQLSRLGNPRVGALDKARARAELVEVLTRRGVFAVPIYPIQGQELEADLFEATVEPSWCKCGLRYAVRDDDLCEPCGDAAEFAAADYSQIRAVGS